MALNELITYASPVTYSRHVVIVTPDGSGWDHAFNEDSNGYLADTIAKVQQNPDINIHVVSSSNVGGLDKLYNTYGVKGSKIIAQNEGEWINAICDTLTLNFAGFDTVSEPNLPVPDFTASPEIAAMVAEGVSVAFTNTSVGNTDDEYSWSFGDGGTSSEVNPTHVYTAEGIYSVVLSVYTRLYGASMSLRKNAYVLKEELLYLEERPAPPTINFGCDIVADAAGKQLGDIPPDGSGFPVTFANLTTGAYTDVRWDFGDGGVSTELNPTHLYVIEGDFNVSLTVANKTPIIGGFVGTLTKPSYISTFYCEYAHTKVFDVTYTVLTKCPFSYDLFLGVVLHKLVYTFNHEDCKPPNYCDTQLIPKGLKPIAVIDLKYTGVGKDSPYKIGEPVKWSSAGFLSYEFVRNINGNGVKLCFNSDFAFPEPVDTQLIISKTIGTFKFTKGANVLGVQIPDGTIKLIKFDMFDPSAFISSGTTDREYIIDLYKGFLERIPTESEIEEWLPHAAEVGRKGLVPYFESSQEFQSKVGKISYTTTEVCDIINSVFDTELIAIPDKYGRVTLIGTSKGPIRVIEEDRGSTANTVFGWSTFGNLGEPLNEDSASEYEVTLYLACIMEDFDMSIDVARAIKTILGPYRTVPGEFEIVSTNYYETLYGEYPHVIRNNIYIPSGHRYIANSVVKLRQIEESMEQPTLENSYFENVGYVDPIDCPNGKAVLDPSTTIDDAKNKNISSPYWRGMICDSDYYYDNYLWVPGDDRRFYNVRRVNAAKNCLEIVGHYDFMAPPPSIKNKITAKLKGPYSLPLDPSSKRFISIRKVSVIGMVNTFTVNADTGDSSDAWGEFDVSSSEITIKTYKMQNVKNPTDSIIIHRPPSLSWSDNSPVTVSSEWTGIGTNELTCVIDIAGHTDDITVRCWLDYGDDTTYQSENWIYVELPFGESVTAKEIILAMRRDRDGLAAMKSKCHWTPSTSKITNNGYIKVKDKFGNWDVSDYKLVDASGKLQILTSADYDYRLRIGGTPEACYANSTFGWNALGELGDKANLPFGPYYRYTYDVDVYATQDLHPALGSNSLISQHSYKPNRYKLAYDASKLDSYLETMDGETITQTLLGSKYELNECGGQLVKMAFDRSLYLNILKKVISSYYKCEGFEVTCDPCIEIGTTTICSPVCETSLLPSAVPIEDCVPLSDDKECSTLSIYNICDMGALPPVIPTIEGEKDLPFIVPECVEIVQFSELTVPVICDIDNNCNGCDDLGTYSSVNFGIDSAQELIIGWASDPILSILLQNINKALANKTPDAVVRLNRIFDSVITNETKYSTSQTTVVNSIFSIDNISNHFTDFRDTIITNIHKDPFSVLTGMAVFSIRYVETFNPDKDVTGKTYNLQTFSTLASTYEQFTIAKFDLYNVGMAVLDAPTEVCTEIDELTNESYAIVPLLLDIETGEEIIPISVIKEQETPIDNKFTIVVPPHKNKLVGIIRKIPTPEKYLSVTETVPATDKMIFCLDEKGFPIGFTVDGESYMVKKFEHKPYNPNNGNVVDPSFNSIDIGLGVDFNSIDTVQAYCTSGGTVAIEIASGAVAQYKVISTCADCVILPGGTLSYLFTVGNNDPIAIEISGTQIMLTDFVNLLETNIQNVDVDVSEAGEIEISALIESLTVVAPSPDPFNLQNVLMFPEKSEFDVTMYYTNLERESTKIPKDVYISG